jgi:hypothetical protein
LALCRADAENEMRQGNPENRIKYNLIKKGQVLNYKCYFPIPDPLHLPPKTSGRFLQKANYDHRFVRRSRCYCQPGGEVHVSADAVAASVSRPCRASPPVVDSIERTTRSAVQRTADVAVDKEKRFMRMSIPITI